jgi:Co/Zn/Cd efflux system component
MHGVFLVSQLMEVAPAFSSAKCPDWMFQHVMADTLGSVGVIISTLLINRYGWTGFDPIASIFIAVLIFASVIPLILDSASLLCLDLGDSREKDVRSALAKVGFLHTCKPHL